MGIIEIENTNDRVSGIIIPKFTLKQWGHELTFYNTEKYCMKLLQFRGGSDTYYQNGNTKPPRYISTSMHYHMNKTESLYIAKGKLTVLRPETDDQWKKYRVVVLEEGSTYHIEPLHRHKLVAANGPLTIIEASTYDEASDSYREDE